jgi:hypothetical protein
MGEEKGGGAGSCLASFFNGIRYIGNYLGRSWPSIANSTEEMSAEGADKQYDVSFRFAQSPIYSHFDEKLFAKLRAQITISVGCSDKHSGEYFKETLEKALKTFDDIVIMLDDSVQWHTGAIGIPEGQECEKHRLEEKAIEGGDKWLRDNLPYIEMLKKKYPSKKIEIKRWKAFDASEITAAVRKINQLFDRDELFQRAINTTALDFLLRVKGYDFILHEPPSNTEELEPGVIYLYKKGESIHFAVKTLNYEDVKDIALDLESQLSDEINEAILSNTPLTKEQKKAVLDITKRREYTNDRLGKVDQNGVPIPPYCSNNKIMTMSTSYLIEETAVMSMLWPKLGCHVELYPAKRSKAMQEVHERLIKTKYLFRHGSEMDIPERKKRECEVILYRKNEKLYYKTNESKDVSESQREMTKQNCVDIAKIKSTEIDALFSGSDSISNETGNKLLAIIFSRGHAPLPLLEPTEISFRRRHQALAATNSVKPAAFAQQ